MTSEPDAGCDVAPQKWGHDSTEALVERVRHSFTWGIKPVNDEARAALTELAERLRKCEEREAQRGNDA